MEADVGAFIGSPTVEQLDKYKKKDLLQLADALKISVVASAKKLKINSDLLSELIALGILPEEPPVASETEGEMKEIAYSI